MDGGAKYEAGLDAPPSMLDASIYLFYGAEQNSWCADKDGNKDIGSYKPSKRDGHGRSTGRP